MRTVLVTGGSRGIGEAIVRRFVRDGWCVAFFWHRSEEAATRLAGECGAIPIRCDVSNAQSVAQGVAQAVGRLGHLDALVCNAGISCEKLVTDTTDDDWNAQLATNLGGCFHACRAALPAMLERKKGSIVTIGSIWGQVGASCEAAYSAAKAGVIGLSKALAKEVGPSGIRVNCVCPGVIRTDMLAIYSEEDLDALAQETPLGRLGTPQDVAECVYWLCSDAAGFVTAQVIGVNGGFGE